MNRVIKGAAVFTLSTGVLLSSLPFSSNHQIVKATTTDSIEQVLAKLTPEQRLALKQLKATSEVGLQLPSSIDLESSNNLSVIVELKDQPGKVAVLEAAADGNSLSLSDAEQNANEAQETFKSDLQTIYKDDIKQNKNLFKINRTYNSSLNGVSIKLPANKVKSLLKSKVVKAIWPNNVIKVEPPTIQEGSSDTKKVATEVFPGINKLHEEGFTGKGVKVGVIDTGIDYNHPDLKDAYKGYRAQAGVDPKSINPSSVKGWDFVDNDADPMETTYDDWKKSGQSETRGSSTFYTEHGTHVSGIIAGRGKNNTDYAVTGVAPDADLYVYRVLGEYGSGNTESVLAGIDKSVSDGMDVINLSLGNSSNDPENIESLALNNAVLSGVTAVVAAGNAGDGMYTVGAPGAAALALTVGANDTKTVIATSKGTLHGTAEVQADLKLLGKGFGDNVDSLKGQNLPVVLIPNTGSPADYNGKDVNGKIVLVNRGTIALVDKVKEAQKHGAKAVIIMDNVSEGFIPAYLGAGYGMIPAFSISYEQGTAVKSKLSTDNSTFSFDEMGQVSDEGSKLASFSSRGPARITYDIKPEVTAPGVSVFSSVPPYMHGADQIGNYQYAYDNLSGTSMATPNVAGVAALLLQANPNLTPAQIKETLMNTADPLNGDYSVYESGAGQVDPYEAIHAQTRIEVVDETLGKEDKKGNLKTVKDLTGALAFGVVAPAGSSISDQRTLNFYNNSNQSKTYDVNVKYQTGHRGSLDADANGVMIVTDKSIKVGAKSKKKSVVGIAVPKSAALGVYEGFVTYTNHDNPNESYQLPFAIKTVEEGIDHITADPPAYTTAVEAGYNGIRWSVGLDFQLKSHMRTMDFFLIDPKTNQEIGFLGTLDGLGADDNVEYYLKGVMNEGMYYPLTGNPDQPIAYDYEQTKPGLYKIRMVGTNDQGKTFSSDAPVYYSVTQPTLNLSADSGVYEYSPEQQTVSLTGSVYDPGVDEMKAGGIDASQAKNKLFYTVPTKILGGGVLTVPLDGNGNFTTQIPLNKTIQPFKVEMYAQNMATVQNYYSHKLLYYVKKGTPYGTALPNKQTVKAGETVTITLSMNNMANMKQAVYSFVDPSLSNADLVSIKPHATLDGKVDIKTVNTDVNIDGTMVKRTDITATLTGDTALTGLSGKVPMVDITYKVKDNSGSVSPSLAQFNVLYSNTDDTKKSSFGISLPYQVERTYSFMKSWVNAEAFGLQTTDEPLTMDYIKAGAKVKITDEAGKEYPNTLGNDGFLWHLTSNLPVTDKPFTLEVDMPGHFTVKKIFTIGLKENGEVKPYSKALYYDRAPAGDVNKDNVIDVKDALYIQTYWETNKRAADINFDGVVNEKDMQYVINNYLMQNPWMDKAPKAEKKYKSQTLESIKSALGIQ
ncbi:S8 family serine peptidase [Gottfriedia acidiceleris]|uniref:S8 family serine peptidase n=1 Tax=Gottfriedia acidiceleris TaxID=371036 RepID=UPI0030005808